MDTTPDHVAATHAATGTAVDRWLDAGATNCGRLIALVAEALGELVAGQVLGVVAYDPSAQVDLTAWCRLTGHRLLVATDAGDHLEFVVRKRA
ncbi:MAG TPA: sulfurtransferase TusA family protein [Thermomicrobiales bacterium]|nr:sulfurtransferase TusA family protein [Thermomicrobiales bacterium]